MPSLLNILLRQCAGTRDAGAEVVNGPHRGYFVAAYATPSVEGYIAYAKVFRSRPLHPWEGAAVAKYAANGDCQESALGLAEFRALNAISSWTR